MEDEVRSAVGLLHAGANETEAGDESVLGVGWGFAGDGKHAAPFESLPKHGSIAGLKDMEGEEVVRKEDGLRQNHHPDLLRQIHLVSIHWVEENGSRR